MTKKKGKGEVGGGEREGRRRVGGVSVSCNNCTMA